MTPPPCTTCAHKRRRYAVLIPLPDDLSFCRVCHKSPSGLALQFCDIARKPGQQCGPEGKLWEPRMSLVQRIIARVRG